MKSQVYSILSGEEIEIQFPTSLIPSVKHPLRKHSGVVVRNILNGKTETGSIVSHLPLSDWAVANGYRILATGRCYRASPSEVTRLF